MAVKFTIFAADAQERQQLEQALLNANGCALAGRALPLDQPFAGGEALLHQVQQQAPEAALVALPAGDAAAAFALIAWLKSCLPQTAVMAVGALDAPAVIVAAMRAGAGEFLERPLRPQALEEAISRLQGTRQALIRPSQRGKLIVVLGARGGCGSTTTAVNLAVSLQAQQRRDDPSVLLLDAAPLGHTALQLNLKPQFSLADLLSNSARLDTAMLSSLRARHRCGLDLLAGPSAPIAGVADSNHAGWLELLLNQHPLVVADLSARLDGLTQAMLERADRILFVTQTDMVSLWSAAKVRQYLDPANRLRFELVLNRYTATPETDLGGVESITHAPVLWKLPNAHALVVEAIERGEPPALSPKSDLSRSFRDLAANLLGRPAPRRRGWLPFLRLHPAPSLES
ncbi:MAG: hypothetical protein ACTHJX_05340 [Terriglobales bacterium]